MPTLISCMCAVVVDAFWEFQTRLTCKLAEGGCKACNK